MGFRRVAAAIAAVGALVVVGVMPGQAATLDDMKAAGTLKCGINTGLPGFAFTDDEGNWTGLRRRLLPGAGRRRAGRCGQGLLR